MDPQKILNLFGHSILDPGFESILNELGIPERPSAVQDRHGVQVNNIYSSEKGISFEFTTKVAYKNFFGEPKSMFTDEKFELILKVISFYSRRRYPFPLPLELAYGDNYENICKKIGSRPVEKFKGIDYNYGYSFIKDDFRIQVSCDDNNRLSGLSIFLLEFSEHKRIELKKALKEQNKHLHPLDGDKLKNLRKKLPTSSWRNRMKEGDNQFTDQNIRATEEKLLLFMDQVATAAAEKKANKVHSAIKKFVVAVNKLNEAHESFIDTQEREELVEFLEEAIGLTGFQIPESVDMTEEWREW